MSDRAARLVLAVASGTLAVLALVLDLPSLSDRNFWNDGATYYSMAVSLAEDLDLRYEARDLERVTRVYPAGPQGIFMKKGRGGDLYFAKPYLYPAVAAPFVALVGAPRGLLLVNALFLALALWLGYDELRRRTAPGRALALTLVLVLGTMAPLYFVWLTPECFNLGLITAGLVAWARGRPLLAAVLLGMATYSKPTNLFLALPLGVEPLLQALRGLLESVRRGLVMGAVVLALFGLNWVATGEMNYQGGERKTFYQRFPFETGVTFDNSGFWMTTDYVGPLVEGRDEDKYVGRTAPPRPAEEIPDSFIRNLAYFWIGRFGGAVPYFFPVVLAAAVFLMLGPRDRTGWLAFTALLVSYLVYIWLIPDNWYGGGGTVGNRYFVNLVPLAFFLVPRGREWVVTLGGAAAAAVFIIPVLAAPIHHSRFPGDHATWATYRVFPAELTMLNDLSVFLDIWRKKRPYGDTEGDPKTGRRAEPTAYYLYFLDNGTYGQEASFGENGFWLKGGETAEVVLRALEPVRQMKVRISGGPSGDLVTVRLGRQRRRVPVGALRTQDVDLEPRGPGYGFYDSFVYLLRFESRVGGSSPEDPRTLGAFVRIRLEVTDRKSASFPPQTAKRNGGAISEAEARRGCCQKGRPRHPPLRANIGESAEPWSGTSGPLPSQTTEYLAGLVIFVTPPPLCTASAH